MFMNIILKNKSFCSLLLYSLVSRVLLEISAWNSSIDNEAKQTILKIYYATYKLVAT